MNSYKRALSIALLGVLILIACQPVMPVDTDALAAATSESEEAQPALRDIPGEVLIPAGPFQMGCDEENPAESCRAEELPLHTVYLDTYYIDQYEVTNIRYRACVDAGGCPAMRRSDSMTRDSYYGNPEFDEYPVVFADWVQASDFCAWEGKRLPTEAEWMKAARGPDDTRKYPWGDEEPSCELVNYWEGVDGCVGDTSEVGSYPAGASPYGVMDMAGNVEEWANDWYAGDYYAMSPSENPQGPENTGYRVALGGGMDNGTVSKLDVTSRNGWNATSHWGGTGFRCAHSP